jgi:hypothetical protein
MNYQHDTLTPETTLSHMVSRSHVKGMSACHWAELQG